MSYPGHLLGGSPTSQRRGSQHILQLPAPQPTRMMFETVGKWKGGGTSVICIEKCYWQSFNSSWSCSFSSPTNKFTERKHESTAPWAFPKFYLSWQINVTSLTCHNTGWIKIAKRVLEWTTRHNYDKKNHYNQSTVSFDNSLDLDFIIPHWTEEDVE